MATATISLPDDQWARLRLHAAMKGRPLDDVIREAVEAYLAALPELPTPRVTEPEVTLPNAEWQAKFEALLAQIRSKVPPDMTPEEIEREITLASEEARQERIAERNGRTEERSYVTEPSVSVFDPEWRAGFDADLARLRDQVPPDMTPEEIDAEIDAAWEEVRAERRARQGHGN